MRAHSLILLVLMFASNLAIAQTSSLIASGFEKLEARELNEAIKLFSDALKQEPRDTSALSGIIRAHLLANNLRDAQRNIDNAIKEHPSNPEFLMRRGMLNNARGQNRRAIIDYEKALELSGGKIDLQIYLNRGITFLQEENYVEALEDFTEVLNINPRNAAGLNYKAFANYRLNNFAEAISDYTKALDLDPENAASYYNRGMSYLRSGNKTSACTDFHQACSRGNMNACRMIMSECSGRGN